MQQHATITEATFMRDASLRSTAKPRGRPLHKMLVSFSAAYFAGAFVTDLAYWRVPDVLCERFSIWLITAGMVMVGLATIDYVIYFAIGKQIDWLAWAVSSGYARLVFPRLMYAFSV